MDQRAEKSHESNNKWLHTAHKLPFEFVAASAIFWNASKYDEIAWIAALQRKENAKTHYYYAAISNNQ